MTTLADSAFAQQDDARVASQCRSLWNRLASATGWTCSAWVASRVANVIALLYAARLLGKASFGEYAIAQAAVGAFSLVGAIGFGTTATRCVSYLRERDPERAGRIAGLLLGAASLSGALAAAALCFLTDVFSYSWSSVVRLSAPAVLMYSIDGVVTGILSGVENFRTIAIISAGQGIAMVVSTTVLTPRFGVRGAVAALVLSATLTATMDCIFLYREVRHRRAPFSLLGALRESRVLVEFSFPVILNSIVLSGTYLFSLSLLGSKSLGTASAGVFALGRQIGIWIQVMPQVLMRAILPVLSERLGADRSSVSRIVLTTHALYMVSCFPLCAMAICAVRPLLSLIAPGFRDERIAISALIAASALGVARGASELLLVADGRAWTNLSFNALWNSFMLAGALVAYQGAPTTVACYATVLGLFLAAVMGNRIAHVPQEGRPWRTDVCMILIMVTAAAASLPVRLAVVSPLVGMGFAMVCCQWFLPPGLLARWWQRLRSPTRPAEITRC